MALHIEFPKFLECQAPVRAITLQELYDSLAIFDAKLIDTKRFNIFYYDIHYSSKFSQTQKEVSFNDEWNGVDLKCNSTTTKNSNDSPYSLLGILKPAVKKNPKAVVCFESKLINSITIGLHFGVISNRCYESQLNPFWSTVINAQTLCAIFNRLNMLPNDVQAYCKKKLESASTTGELFYLDNKWYLAEEFSQKYPLLKSNDDWQDLFDTIQITTELPTLYICKVPSKAMSPFEKKSSLIQQILRDEKVTPSLQKDL